MAKKLCTSHPKPMQYIYVLNQGIGYQIYLKQLNIIK